ncbi:MAG: hypothetical protein Q9195_008234 [Heterodermia aff. obscurata]
MKSSLALAALLCAPEVFAVALPHIPKLNSRWYHKDELDTNNAGHAKRGNDQDHGNELKRRRGIPIEVAGPSSTPVTTTGAGTGVSGPSAIPTSFHLGVLPRPAATLHNPYIGNHPFIGHGPVIRLPTATPSASGYGENFTLTYLATGTTPPIANATATIYIPPIVRPIDNTTVNATSCDAVPELIDENGNFLPGDLQPKYNGSSHCSSTVTPDYEVSEPEAERVVIEGHIQGENEIVEVDITPLPANISSWNNTADNDYGTYYGANPTGYYNYPSDVVSSTSLPDDFISSIPTTTFSAPAFSSSAPVHHQKVPTSSTPGFTGPKVRRALVHSDLDDEEVAALADLEFD